MRAPAATPGRTVALVVGLDTYVPTGEAVPGPSLDAARFAAALTGRGVPAEQVHCLLSPDPAARSEVDRLAPGWQPADYARLTAIVKSEFDGWSGEALIVYWVGHGIQRDDRTLLFFPDRGDITLGTSALRRYLRGSPQFPRQLIVIDACRIHAVDAGLQNQPAEETLPSRDNQDVRHQVVVHAVGEGERSGVLAAERTTAFGQAFRTVCASLRMPPWLASAADLRAGFAAVEDVAEPIVVDVKDAEGRGGPPVTLSPRAPAGGSAEEMNQLIGLLHRCPVLEDKDARKAIERQWREKWDPPAWPLYELDGVQFMAQNYWWLIGAPRFLREVVEVNEWAFPDNMAPVVDLKRFLDSAVSRRPDGP